ncbi:hypothetical protein E2320_020721, partial [Naja naja]
MLCEGLRHPDCKVEKLRSFAEILHREQTTVRNLDLLSNDTNNEAVEMLCEGLKHPNCNKYSQGVKSIAIYSDILFNFYKTQSMLAFQEIIVAFCTFSYRLGGKFLTEFFSSHLSDVFRKCQRLKELELFPINNIDTVVEMLCKGLKHSDCKLKVLRINGEYLKILCGHSLSFGRQIARIVKIIQNLQKLYFHGDCFSDYEMKLLCKELKDSRHKLEEL